MKDKVKCNILKVPKNCCYILFSKHRIYYSENVRYKKSNFMFVDAYTVRNEGLIIDLDKNRKIVGIELINPKMKPCQK